MIDDAMKFHGLNHHALPTFLSGKTGDVARRPPGSGFTLIELMIVVAIVAIVVAIAYPSYLNSVIKGKRAQGRTALLNTMQQEERYLTQSGSYMTFAAGATGNTGTTSSATGVAVPFVTTSGDTPSQAAYKIAATTCPITPVPSLQECVLLQAVPNFVDAAAGTLTFQSTGLKSCTGTNTTVCW